MSNMTELNQRMQLWKLPESQGRDGIHISAQLRVDGMQLSAHRIGWAQQTTEKAAQYIDKLEDMFVKSQDESKTAKELVETLCRVLNSFPTCISDLIGEESYKKLQKFRGETEYE